MSFPKAKMKRFNEVDADVPPVGAYDPVVKKEDTGAVFDKAERFKKPSDVPSASMIRVRSKDSLTDVKITPNVTPTQRDSGREIRVLAREKSDLTRKVETQMSELKRLELQLNSVIADRDELENINENLKSRLNMYERDSEEETDRPVKTSDYTAELEELRNIIAEKDVVINELRVEIASVRVILVETEYLCDRRETSLKEQLASFVELFDAQIKTCQSSAESSNSKMALRFQTLKEKFELWRINMSNRLKEEMEKSCKLENLLSTEVAGESEISRALDSIKLQLEEAVCRENNLTREISVMTTQLELAKEQELVLVTLNEEMKQSMENFKEAKIIFETKMAEEVSRRETVEVELQNLKMSFKELGRSLEEKKTLESQLRSTLVAETEKASLLDSTRQQLEESICQNGHLKEAIAMMSTQLELITQEHEINIRAILAEIEQRQETFKERENRLNEKLNEEMLKREIVETELESLRKLDLKTKEHEMTIRNLQEEIEQRQDSFKEREKLLDEKLTEEMLKREIVETELESLRKQNLETKEHEMTIRNLQEEIEQLQNSFKEREKLLDEKLNEEMLKHEIVETELENLRKLDLETKEREMTIRNLQEEIEQLQDSFKAREKQLDEKLNEEMLKREIVETELENLKKLHLTATKEHEMTIRNLQDEIKQHGDALKEREIVLEAKVTEEVSLRELVVADLEQHTKALEILQQNLDEEKAVRLELEKVLKTNIEISEASARDRDAENENLKSKVAELSVERDFSEEIIKRIKKDVARKDGELAQLQEVIAKNHELVSVKGSLVRDLEACHSKLSAVISANDELMKSMDNFTSEKLHLESRMNDLLGENHKLTVEVQDLSRRESELLQEFQISDDKIRTMQQEFSRSTRELHKRLVETEKELNGYKTRTDIEGKHNEALLQKVTSDYEIRIQTVSTESDRRQEEMIKWRTLYEQLKEKIAPFQDQLDAYEIERQLLESQNVEATSTLKKMGDQLATLVGHHNQRQRIHYVNKLKEDFFKVKQENDKLWVEVLKLRKICASTSTTSSKKFDPRQAFQHSKENQSSPLRDSNR